MNIALLRSAVVIAILGNVLAGCGGGTVTFGGGGDGGDKFKVTVKGNVDAITPVTSRDIVVFVYSIDDNSTRCACPGVPADAIASVGKAAVLPSGTTEFSLTGLDSGPIGIVFLLDNAGNLADGEINAGDPIAVLDDVDCQIDSVAGNKTITLKDVDLSFASVQPAECKDGVNNPPAPGRARANLITVSTTPAAP